jgi:N-acetylmuramoyl-L-alanine amidase
VKTIRRAGIVLASVLLVLPASSLAGPVTLQVPWSQPATLDTWQEEGITYVRATEFFGALGGSVDFGPYPAAATVQLRGHRILLYHNSPFVRMDQTVFSLSVPAKLHEGDVAVPVATTAELLGLVLGLRYRWNSEVGLLTFYQSDVTVGPVVGELKRNGLIIDIRTDGPVAYEVFPSMDGWLNISIPGAKRGQLDFNRRPFSRYIWEFKSYQFDEAVQLSFRLHPDRVTWEHRIATDPYRIEVTLIDTTFELDSTDAPGLLSPGMAPSTGLDTDPMDVIVVDAGHGGEDLGAVGPRGTREKDVVLGVALELARLLESDPDFTVILTRDDDTFIPLKRRAEIANEANADVFISLHANSAPRKSARGFETFFLSAAKSDEARATEQLENASLRFEESRENSDTDDLDFILTDLLQNQFLVESADLAQTIQREFGETFKGPDRGVNQAGFLVLYHAYMPAVLVETGFVSNRQEESWLKKKSTHERMAESLYRSILTFREKSESQL